MQSLKLADHLFEITRTGAKCATIRRGRRDVALGPLRLESVSGNLEPVDVIVERVSYTAYSALTDEDWAANGRTDLRQFYGDLLDEEMTVVHYRLPVAKRQDAAAEAEIGPEELSRLAGVARRLKQIAAERGVGELDGLAEDLLSAALADARPAAAA